LDSRGVSVYEGVSKSFRTESITKYMLTSINTRWEATQRLVAAKLTKLSHKIALQLHLVAKRYTICSGRSVKLTTHLHLVPRLIAWSCVSASPYVYMAWCLIKQTETSSWRGTSLSIGKVLTFTLLFIYLCSRFLIILVRDLCLLSAVRALAFLPLIMFVTFSREKSECDVHHRNKFKCFCGLVIKRKAKYTI
jgi:hypothetical protein